MRSVPIHLIQPLKLSRPIAPRLDAERTLRVYYESVNNLHADPDSLEYLRTSTMPLHRAIGQCGRGIDSQSYITGSWQRKEL